MAQADQEFLLERSIALPPGGEIEADLKALPSRWGVALLLDENQKPLQLISLKDLRRGIAARLGEPQAPGKRVNWREVVRSIRWQTVDSDFESDWVYLKSARRFFPETWHEMLLRDQVWFVHIDPNAKFPHYNKTEVLTDAPGVWLGPLPDKASAGRLIELVEDAFDLCRYHHILVQYPNGKACAYKEMGKCPAPCDGSLSIEQYRRMIDMSVNCLSETARHIAEHSHRMEQAAAEQQYEVAAKIRAYIQQLSQLGKGPFRHVHPVSEFSYVTLQRGASEGQAKVFLILPGRIQQIVCLNGEPERPQELLRTILKAAEDSHSPPDAAEIAMTARHLFSPKKNANGVFVPLADFKEAALMSAYSQVSRKPVPATDNAVVH